MKKRRVLTNKQRFIGRHRTAYCKKHFDCALWCVFRHRDDDVALVCAFTVYRAWEKAVEELKRRGREAG